MERSRARSSCAYPRAAKSQGGAPSKRLSFLALKFCKVVCFLFLNQSPLFLESLVSKTHGTCPLLVEKTGNPNSKCRGCATSRVNSGFRNMSFVSEALVLSFDLSCSTIFGEFESLVSRFRSDTLRVHARSSEFEFSALLGVYLLGAYQLV